MTVFSASSLSVCDPPASKLAEPSWPTTRTELLEQLRREAPAPGVSRAVLIGSTRGLEISLIALTGLMSIGIPRGGAGQWLCCALLPCVGFAAVAAFQALSVYTVPAFRSPVSALARIAGVWAVICLVLACIVGFSKFDVGLAPSMFASWFGLGLFFVTLERFALSGIVSRLARSGRLDRRTVLVGGGELAHNLLKTLSTADPTEAKLLGVFDDRSDARIPGTVEGFPKLGNVDDLVELARDVRIDLVIFALPITAEKRILEMLRKLWVLPIDVRLAAHASKLNLRPRSYSYVGQAAMLDVFDKPLADWDIVVKGALDRILGAIALILLSPLMIGAAIAIKLDSRGPLLFKQKRYGFNNELIDIYKFRSMYAHQLDSAAAKLVTRDDPRVTRVGRILRRSSIDELPQLFNVVFNGNLSLVGPRPHAAHAKAANHQYDEVVESYFARHRVKPGITGWAQIHGWRGETDTEEKIRKRVDHDIYYIENWSPLLDLYILAMTPLALLKGDNAY